MGDGVKKVYDGERAAMKKLRRVPGQFADDTELVGVMSDAGRRTGPGGEPGPAAQRDRARRASDRELPAVPIAVLAPSGGRGRTQLRATMALARQAGHPVSWYEPRIGGASIARTVRALAGDLSGVERLVVGDPFSGVIGVIISITRARQVTIVDDGTATLEFARQWAAGEHLTRWHEVATPQQRRHIATLARDQIAGTVRRRLSPAVGCQLRLFTALPVDVPKIEICPTRTPGPGPSVRRPGHLPAADLAGTSLVETGMIKGEPYLAGVESLIARYGVGRYFAHRKEADWKLDLIARMGVEIVRPDLPLELVARRGPIGRRLLSFPSTVVHTLPVVLAGTGVEITVCEIDSSWYPPQVNLHADRFLGRVQSSGPDPARPGGGGCA